LSTAPPGQLLWRCRRGMKELDLLLQGWLEQRYPGATAAERARFEAFLALPDPEIAGLLLAHATPADPNFVPLVDQLVQLRA
jgi:antitoxin CptB